MTAAQWQRAKEVTADALELEPDVRPGFVAAACAADTEVRQEVLRLLAGAEGSLEDFLSSPAFRLHNLLVRSAELRPCFTPGQTVAGRFRIERFINRGGMGEVYAATDQDLGELVALKTIRPVIASAPAAIERFKREVSQSRRITHPNVCRVHDIFSQEEPSGESLWFLTMELLDGRTLGDRLGDQGPCPMDQALPLIRDMVEALHAAHSFGIVHRDFKPNNVMLVKRGPAGERAVVTDFGLALSLSPGSPTGDAAADGTPAYMAPEQVGGQVGFAADQFALGLVLCEVLTGSRPTLDRTSAVPWRRQLDDWLEQQSRQQVNARARAVIRRCLQFRPEDRFRHVRDLLPVLDGSRERTRRCWAAGASALAAALAVAVILAVPVNGPQVQNAVRATPESGLSNTPAMSRDGRWIAYSSERFQPGANLDIYLQAIAGGPARRLTTDQAVDHDPALSPDGSQVAFHSERNGGGVYVVRADGTGERLLAAGGWSPAYSPDGKWIAYWLGTRDDAAPSAQLYLQPAEGGPPRRLAADFADARYPTWDSSGRNILFDGCRASSSSLSTCTDWWVIRPDGTGPRNTGALALLKSLKIEPVTPPQKAWNGDRIIFGGSRDAGNPLWELRLSADALRAAEPPRRITAGDAGEREPSASDTGALVFVRIAAAVHIWRLPLRAGGRAVPVTDDPALDGCPNASRDGNWLYFTRKIRGLRQLIARQLDTGRETPLATPAENVFWPVATADGARAAFELRREADSTIWLAERAGAARRLCSRCSHPTSWFAGERALFHTTAAGEIALLDLQTGASRVVLAPPPGTVLGWADWSPVNQHLLFTAGPHGAGKQVFTVRFPADTASPAGAWLQLTDDVAEIDKPRWSLDGSAFYFLSKRDAFNCVWGRRFNVQGGSGAPFEVMHYHDLRLGPDRTTVLTRGLTVTGDAIYMTAGEVFATVWSGTLPDELPLVSHLRKLAFWRRPL